MGSTAGPDLSRIHTSLAGSPPTDTVGMVTTTMDNTTMDNITTDNTTDTCPWKDSWDRNYWTGFNVFILLLALLTVVANILLVVTILKTPGLRKQRFNLFMLSLACTDLLVGILGPFNTLRQGRWIFGSPICHMVTSLVVISITASHYNFVSVNLDRLFAIMRPISYRSAQKEGRDRTKVEVAVCWLMGLVVAIPMFADTTRTVENNGSGCLCEYPFRNTEWIWTAVALSFIIPTTAIIFTWVTIVVKFALESEDGIDKQQSARKTKATRRITVVMGVITFIFMISTFPYFFLLMDMGMGGQMGFMGVVGPRYIVAGMYANSLINPVLYISINRQMRAAFFAIFFGRADLTRGTTFDESDSDTKLSTLKKRMVRALTVKGSETLTDKGTEVKSPLNKFKYYENSSSAPDESTASMNCHPRTP